MIKSSLHIVYLSNPKDSPMHETHIAPNASKTERYQTIVPAIEALLSSDRDLFIAGLANVNALLKETFGWLWVGFYLVDDQRTELQLSAFQGPVACTRIAHGRGVCGQAWAQNRTIVVPDVNQHPDHIACSSRSQSEIVVPLYNQQQQIIGVLDADAEQTNQFDEIDAEYLQQICQIITKNLLAQ